MSERVYLYNALRQRASTSGKNYMLIVFLFQGVPIYSSPMKPTKAAAATATAGAAVLNGTAAPEDDEPVAEAVPDDPLALAAVFEACAT